MSKAVAIVEQYGKSGGYFVGCGYQLGLYWGLSATTTRTARKTCTHQRAAERVGEESYQKILSIAVAMVSLVGISCFAAGYQLRLYRELPATTTRTARKTCTHQRAAERVGEEFYQKILSIAVAMVSLVGISCFAAGYQLRLYRELPATTTRTARKTCTHQRSAESVGEQGYQKILSIAVAMVSLVGISCLAPIS